MKNIFFICVFSLIAFTGCTDDDELYKNSGDNSTEESTRPNEDIDQNLFESLNLDYPGLEQVKAWYETGNYYSAAKALLDYYKGRIGITNPNVSLMNPTITEDEQLFADFAMDKYRFYVNKNYFQNAEKKQPWSLQSEDKTINWQFKPEGADAEYQKQLHRHYWMPYQGKAYLISHDEKYISSWKEVYADWIKQNPKPETPNTTTWWQLQVSTRIMGQTDLFEYFKFSPNFTPEWLSFFLAHFAEHADYLAAFRYQDENNILLSQGTALAFAGTLFPEFKNASKWQEMGFNILNEQTKKQYLADGMLGDLSLHYHMANLIEFCSLRKLVAQNKLPDNILSPENNAILEKAAELVMYFTYPNYFIPKSNYNCTSAFNDSWVKTKNVLSNNFKNYAEMFPENQELRYMATVGEEGTCPDTNIKAFEASGHYVLRNGWSPASTMLIHSNNYSTDQINIWSHNQPDNGTFSLYHNGRDFFPDSGVCSYVGDATANELRSWFRQTKVHNTLTLDGKNITTTQGKLLTKVEGNTELVVTENQGYTNFKHRRAIFFVNKEFFVFVDEGFGNATGTANLCFHLCEGDEVKLDADKHGAHTEFGDESNILVRSFGEGITYAPFDGRIAYNTDGKYNSRKAYFLNMSKTADAPVRYITVIYPTDDATTHTIQAQFTDAGKDHTKGVAIEVEVDSKTYKLSYNL